MVCSSSPADVERVIQLRQQHPELHICLGLHPLDDSPCGPSSGSTLSPGFEEHWPSVREVIRAEHLERRLAAVGEIGLDFSRPLLRQKAEAKGVSEAQVKQQQLRAFESQVKLAIELNLPVNVRAAQGILVDL